MNTPDYVLAESFFINLGTPEPLELKAGAFVRPIGYQYVPKHIIERNRFFNKHTEVYCYTHYGIHAINRFIIRKAEGGEYYGV